MKALFLDLASHASPGLSTSSGLIACVDDERTVASIEIHPRSTDRTVAEEYQNVLQKAKWTDGDLTHLACVTGPGGFTSLRVAVSFINALSFALNIPSTGIHLSDLKRAQAKDATWWFHSTKKTLVFIKKLSEDSEPQLKTLDELSALVRSGESWTGELIEEHQALISEKGLKPAEAIPLSDLLPTFLKNLTYTQNQTLLPWYGRGW